MLVYTKIIKNVGHEKNLEIKWKKLRVLVLCYKTLKWSK